MTILCASMTQTRPGTGEKGQVAKSKTFEVSKPFLRAKQKSQVGEIRKQVFRECVSWFSKQMYFELQ